MAGGEARRLGGVVKGALTDRNGICTVERMIRRLEQAGAAEVVVSANDGGPYSRCGRVVVGDLRDGAGPLAGIEAALTHFAGRWDATLLVPCDVPDIDVAEMVTLKEAFLAGAAPIVFAQTGDDRRHPLCAVVHSSALGAVSAALDRRQRSVGGLWRRLGAVGVPFGDERAFFNMNDPEDLARWRRREALDG